jgi:hypothetical protein
MKQGDCLGPKSGLDALVDRDVDSGFGTPPPPLPPAKILYTISESLTFHCRVTWALSERINLFSRQIMIIPKNKGRQHMQYGRAPDPGNFLEFLAPTPLSLTLGVQKVFCPCRQSKSDSKKIEMHSSKSLYAACSGNSVPY